MKKLFAIAMSAAMVMSMAAVAFAADPVESKKVIGVSGDGDFYAKVSDNIVQDGAWDNGKIPYGKTIYFRLKDGNGNEVTDSDYVKSMSIKATWDMNGSAIAKMEIVKKKATDGNYYYYLAITGKDSTTTADTDVAGKITLKKSGKYGTNGDVDFNVNFTYGYTNNLDNTSVAISDSAAIWEFKNGTGAEDDEFQFEEWEDAYFTVNTQGQGKIVLAADVDYDADIASKYPTANIDFFNGNGASFNKIGELSLPADADTHVYAVNADGTLSSVKATYDEYEESWKIKTRTLGRYLISDVELKSTAPSVPGSSSVDGVVTPGTPTVPSNPSTGAKA